MEPPLHDPNNQNDDVFFDAFHHCPFCNCSDNDSPESSGLCDSDPPSSPPATTIRRRSIRRRSPVRDSSDTGPDSNSTNGTTTSFQKTQNLAILKENENFPEKRDSDQGEVGSPPSPSVVTEERNEESTLTTASRDDGSGDSADSAAELSDSPPSLLEYVAGLVIRAIVLQIKFFVLVMKCPMLFLFHACMFFVDPFGTTRKGKGLLMGILGRVWCIVCAQGWFNEHKSFWNVAFRCGWGFFWSMYVCFILFALLVSSLVVSGFLVKRLVEKPFQVKQVLNFDYTKQSPVAFVPIISCPGVGGGHHSDDESGIAVDNDRWVNKRVIPAKQKVQVTVSLLVPESEYNTNLGVFQVSI